MVEPYRLVSTGQRWYLIAYDLDRDDWRTFRVDRVDDPFATGARFTPRELPTGSAAEYLRQSMYRRQETYELVVTFEADVSVVGPRVPGWMGVPEPLGAGRCRLRATVGDAVDWMAVRLAMTGVEFRVQEPPELVDVVRELGRRLVRAAGEGA